MKHLTFTTCALLMLACGSSGSSSGSLPADAGGGGGGGSNVDAGSFACGQNTCSPAQYCMRTVGGACAPVDGGGCQASQSSVCVALPVGCSQCSCVPLSPEGSCQEQNGHVYVAIIES